MAQYNIAVVVGSLRKDSFNQKLAGALQKLFPPISVSPRCVSMICHRTTRTTTPTRQLTSNA
jgi:hypothetical protein